MKKGKIKLRKWDIAEHLATEKDALAYLKAAIEDNDPEYLPHAIGAVARARGMTQVARKAGVSRANLYKAFSDGGKPEFSTVIKVIEALGFKFQIAKS
jgi:probable addiction module antidote protein